MKVNGIKCTDYKLLNRDLLAMVFVDTSTESLLAMDTAVLTVQTDTDDPVEVFTGWQRCRVILNVADGSYEVQFIPAVDDVTAAALKSLAEQNASLTKELSTTQSQLEASIQSNAILEECIVEMAGVVYA